MGKMKKATARKRTGITAAQFNKMMYENVPLARLFGFRAISIGHGTARVRLRFHTDVTRAGGTVSGPALMGLADVALFAVVLGMIGKVEMAVTTSLTINFLRKPGPVDVIAEARILKLGKRLAVGECALYSEGDPEMVAHVTGTYSIPPR